MHGVRGTYRSMRTRRPASPAVHRTRYPNVAYISLIDSIVSQCAATSALNKTAH